MHGPIVNLNGESRESLLEKHVAVYYAARNLRQALANAAPHGRDYQTEPNDELYRHDRARWEKLLRDAHEIERAYRLIAERLATE